MSSDELRLLNLRRSDFALVYRYLRLLKENNSICQEGKNQRLENGYKAERSRVAIPSCMLPNSGRLSFDTLSTCEMSNGGLSLKG